MPPTTSMASSRRKPEIPRQKSPDLSAFFRQYVTGKDPLPYDQEFSYAGIQVIKTESKAPWIGLALDRESQDGGYRITNVIPESPADLGGADRGDVLLALDNITLNSSNLDELLAEHHVGDAVALTCAPWIDPPTVRQDCFKSVSDVRIEAAAATNQRARGHLP